MQPQQPETPPPRQAVIFILCTAFINLAGIGVIAPVLPALVGRFVPAEAIALHAGLLFSAYSFFQFLAVPTLGALSDRYGRRPVLLLSLLGSALGFALFGLGAEPWMNVFALLYLGRIIDGITGGNIATIYAFMADITNANQRTRYFAFLGSAAAAGFIAGPLLGGVLSLITPSAPLYAAAVFTLLNVAWGWWAMPESLPPNRRTTTLPLQALNPFKQLANVFSIPILRWPLVGVLLWTLAFAIIQSNLSALAEVQFQWTPAQISTVFLLIGFINVVAQGSLAPRLAAQWGEARLSIAGLFLQALGFLGVALAAWLNQGALVYAAILLTAPGNALAIPALTGLLSKAVGPRDQGRVQGGSQAVQALGRVLGPLWGGWIFTLLGSPAPYWTGALILGCAALCIVLVLPQLMPQPTQKGVE